MGLFTWIWNGIKGLGGLILPVFAKARDFRGLGRKLRWVIHFACLALVLAGLGFLNYALDLEKLLETPLPFLRKVWLPLLFFLIYLLSWLAWWLWVLLGAEQESSAHPDIDTAWEEAVLALERAGIKAAEAPIFLVLGRPAALEKQLFTGSQIEFAVDHAPTDPHAPLHVYANPDGIYVTCPDASLLSRQASLLLEETPTEAESARPPRPAEESAGPAESIGTSTPSEIASPAAAQPIGASETMTLAIAPEGKPENRSTVPEERAVSAPRKAQPRPVLLKNSAEVERLSARLKHLCWLILQERQPYCPVNGILLTIPLAAVANEADANQTGLICQRELAAVLEVLQIQCPVFALFSDIEKLSGFREFIDRFPKGHRQRRLGQQFPYVADLSAQERTELIENGVDWICLELFPPLIYRLMRLERPGQDKMASVMRGNTRLYQLLHHMRGHRRHLSRILSLAVQADPHGVLLGGCYLAGTGRNAAHEQAFLAAVFHRLLESQNLVSWTPAARAEELDCRRWAKYGYAALAVFTSAVISMGYFIVGRR